MEKRRRDKKQGSRNKVGGEPERLEQRWETDVETRQRCNEWETKTTGDWKAERKERLGNREKETRRQTR